MATLTCTNASRSAAAATLSYADLASQKARAWEGVSTPKITRINTALAKHEEALPSLLNYIMAKCGTDAFDEAAMAPAGKALDTLGNTRVLSPKSGAIVKYDDIFGTRLSDNPSK